MNAKFRAFIKLENSVNPMQTVAKINFEKESVTIEQGLVFKFNDVELMQYTGLKDINGVEIFEGDIVKIDDYFNGEMKAKVVFEQGAFGFAGIDKIVSDIVNSNWNDDFLSMAYLSWAYDHLEDYLCNVVIIGNVYENPELMEVTE